jgi:hypothetical protein
MVVGALVLPAVLGLGSAYRYGGWSPGPSSPGDRDMCAMSGGREGDLFLLHHCAPAPPFSADGP